MNKNDLKRFKKLLEEEKAKVLDDIGMVEKEIAGMAANRGSGKVGYSNHMADIGTDAMEQEQTFLRASKGVDYLLSLEDALKRIEEGTYGSCELCDAKIPNKRLEAFLAARLCIGCKSAQEKLRRN
ncbi:MAG: TraR/DksA C4-type zinc finger protein [Candidatus Latescibacterota bacterium]